MRKFIMYFTAIVFSLLLSSTYCYAAQIISQPEIYYGAMGDVAAFTVEATGSEASYRWYYKNNNTTDWQEVGGETIGFDSSELLVTVDDETKGNLYKCIISDEDGEVETSIVYTNLLSVPTNYQETYEFISTMITIDEKLDELGISWDMIQAVLEKDENFAQEFLLLVENEGYEIPEIESADEGTFYTSSRANSIASSICNASFMAEWSVNRSSKVTDQGKETLYMFMAYNIDVPGLTLQTVLDNYKLSKAMTSSGVETAKYITDYDRRAYDQYFNSLNKNAQLNGLTNLILSAGGLVVEKNMDIYINNSKAIKININDLLPVGDSLRTFDDTIKNISTVEELYDRLCYDFSEDDYTSKMISAYATVMSITATYVGNPVPLMMQYSTDMTSTYVNSFSNFYDTAAWAALTRTRNMRISYRYMNMYGMY